MTELDGQMSQKLTFKDAKLDALVLRTEIHGPPGLETNRSEMAQYFQNFDDLGLF